MSNTFHKTHHETQLYPSWIYHEECECWVPPCMEPDLTFLEKNKNLEYVWDEDAYQENGAMGNSWGWKLVKKT